MAHALHPNYADKHDPELAPRLGSGLVLKHNANQRYATNAISATLFRWVCNACVETIGWGEVDWRLPACRVLPFGPPIPPHTLPPLTLPPPPLPTPPRCANCCSPCREVCRRAGVPTAEFAVRSDMACGSTIGPILASGLGVRTVDIGVPQLAMHSIREVRGLPPVARLHCLTVVFWFEASAAASGPSALLSTARYASQHVSLTVCRACCRCAL
jgi:hypothetical protein